MIKSYTPLNLNGTDQRPITLITGACGGMGKACSRLFGQYRRLFLCDVNSERLNAFGDELCAEGYTVVAAVSLDIGDNRAVAELVSLLPGPGQVVNLIHTAGLSPTLAGWDAIMRTNYAGTCYLLDAMAPMLHKDFVAVCIASVAGHMVPASSALDRALDGVASPDFDAGIAAVLRELTPDGDDFQLAGTSYNTSKYGVIRHCERLASAWLRKGARLVTISPGIIATPMGRKEVTSNPQADSLAAVAPEIPQATAMDIARVAEFLCSPQARFITGTDLRVDGGIVARVRQLAAGA